MILHLHFGVVVKSIIANNVRPENNVRPIRDCLLLFFATLDMNTNTRSIPKRQTSAVFDESETIQSGVKRSSPINEFYQWILVSCPSPRKFHSNTIMVLTLMLKWFYRKVAHRNPYRWKQALIARVEYKNWQRWWHFLRIILWCQACH